jgi:bla regulator protein BlaR1
MNPETLRDLGLALIGASMHAAVLGVAVLAVRSLLGRHLGPEWRCLLWLLVIVRLAWPIHLPSPVSLFNLTGPILPSLSAATLPITGWQAIATFWALGSSFLLLRTLFGHARAGWMVRDARPVDSWETWWLWEQCRREIGLPASVALLETSRVNSPCLIGSLRPRLLVPPGFSTAFSGEEMRLVFLHELAHLKRADLLWNWLLEIVRAVHWFNPVVWIAYHKLREDREEACDADALASHPGSNQAYGRILLRFLEIMSSAPSRLSNAFVGFQGRTGAPESLVHRVRAIARFRIQHRTWVVGLCTLVAFVLIGLTDSDVAPSAAATPSVPSSVAN